MIAVSDIGSNSIRVALYKVKDDKVFPLLDKKYTVGLASYVEDGVMSQRGIEVCSDVLNEIKEMVTGLGVEKQLVFATASLRNISNTAECVGKIKERTGLLVDVIDGEAEAFYDRLATRGQCADDALVIDIGGGSTEIILPDGKMYSLPLGSLNSYKKFISKGIIGSAQEYQQITDHFLFLMDNIQKVSCSSVLAIGGSMQALDKMRAYLGSDDLFDVLYNDESKAVSALLKCSPERIHTFFCGLSILRAICSFFSIQTVAVSYHSCREGYLYGFIDREGIHNV